MSRNQDREKATGRYGFEGDFDRLCVCGHRLGVHLAKAPHECVREEAGKSDGCGCVRFRVQRKRTS